MIMLTKNFIPIVGNFFFFNICSEPGPSLSVKKGRGIGINVEVEVRIDRHIRTSIFFIIIFALRETFKSVEMGTRNLGQCSLSLIRSSSSFIEMREMRNRKYSEERIFNFSSTYISLSLFFSPPSSLPILPLTPSIFHVMFISLVYNKSNDNRKLIRYSKNSPNEFCWENSA